MGVLGDLMLDRYLWGTATRLSPEAAVPVVDFVSQSECLGGAGNVAANLAALGAHVEMFGAIGTDEAGRALQKCLRAENIVDKGVIPDPKRVTTVKTRIIARHQQVVRVDQERREALRPETEKKLLGVLFNALKSLDALLISDYDKGLITDDFADRVLDLVQVGRREGEKALTRLAVGDDRGKWLIDLMGDRRREFAHDG